MSQIGGSRVSADSPRMGSQMLAPGDLFFTRGAGFVSVGIRFFTRRIGEARTKVNHVGLVVEGGPIESAVVVEALSRVRRHSLWVRYSLKRRTAIAVYRAKNLNAEQIRKIVEKAEAYVGHRYGWPAIVAHFLDWLFQGAYFFRRIIGGDKYPICSWVVAHAYKEVGLHFGVEARAASPDDIWDFAVEERPDLYDEIRPLIPLLDTPLIVEDKLDHSSN